MKKLIFTLAVLCLASSSLFASLPVPDPNKGDWPVTTVIEGLSR